LENLYIKNFNVWEFEERNVGSGRYVFKHLSPEIAALELMDSKEYGSHLIATVEIMHDRDYFLCEEHTYKP
jgi:hypothetical protein